MNKFIVTKIKEKLNAYTIKNLCVWSVSHEYSDKKLTDQVAD